MIQANELRIGNYVQGYTTGKVISVNGNKDAIDAVEVEYPEEFEWQSCEQLNPIELTPEILEKAGFRLQPQKTSIYIKGRLKLWLGRNGAIAYLKNEDTDESYYIPKNPQSLHELQNIHYYITGEELSIQL